MNENLLKIFLLTEQPKVKGKSIIPNKSLFLKKSHQKHFHDSDENKAPSSPKICVIEESEGNNERVHLDMNATCILTNDESSEHSCVQDSSNNRLKNDTDIMVLDNFKYKPSENSFRFHFSVSTWICKKYIPSKNVFLDLISFSCVDHVCSTWIKPALCWITQIVLCNQMLIVINQDILNFRCLFKLPYYSVCHENHWCKKKQRIKKISGCDGLSESKHSFKTTILTLDNKILIMVLCQKQFRLHSSLMLPQCETYMSLRGLYHLMARNLPRENLIIKLVLSFSNDSLWCS